MSAQPTFREYTVEEESPTIEFDTLKNKYWTKLNYVFPPCLFEPEHDSPRP